MEMSPSDMQALHEAKRLLEHPGLAAKITNLLGTPVQKGVALLPTGWQAGIASATHKALQTALAGAIKTMDGETQDASLWWHKLAVTASGSVGGAFGLPALIVELPLSTTIMLRSIADIARANGENLADVQTQLACLEVFAMGGPTTTDDASESGYFAIRGALARSVTEAAEYIAEKGLVEEGAPVLVRFIAQVAARFQVQVSEKAAAVAVPILGAIGGGAVNLLFIEHFQQMSRGHFTVRRLERQYSPERVRLAFDLRRT